MKCAGVLEAYASYPALRRQARGTAETMFSATAAREFWDDFYCKVTG
jgi:hypothetical protein